MSWIPPRSYAPEIMDRTDNDREALEGALRSIRRVNRWLGGQTALRDALRQRWTDAKGNTVRLLDIGTGEADLPIAALEWARRDGIDLEVVAVELDPITAAIARDAGRDYPQIEVIRADAFELPFADNSFDFVTASMFLHHFHELEVVRLLHRFAQVASRAVIVNDLRRHRLPYAFIRTLCTLLRPHPMFVHDAPLSVLRGFTDEELAWAAHQCTTAPAHLERRWPFRLVLTLETGS